MTDGAPRPVRGRIARSIGRPQSDFDEGVARLCPRCGASLSRYNDGPYCNPCDEVAGEPRIPVVRGRVAEDA